MEENRISNGRVLKDDVTKEIGQAPMAITVHERVTDTPANCFGQKVLHEAGMARPLDGLLRPFPMRAYL